MKHFPIFLAVENKLIVVSGGGEAALAKLRLLMKTQAAICVYAEEPIEDVRRLAMEGRIALVERALIAGDVEAAVLFYAANDDDAEDARVAAIARTEGVLVNWVDNLSDSQTR